MIILNELQTRLNCKNISSFCSIFKCSAPSCFRYSKNLPFLQLTKNIFRINDAQHPPTIPRKVTSLKIKLQQDFTVRIFPFLANHSFPHKQECFQLSEPSWREVKTVRGIHLAAFLWVFLVQGSHYSLWGEVAEKHRVYMGRVVLSLNRHVSRRRQMKELLVLQTGENNILPVVFICRAPWFMPSHL